MIGENDTGKSTLLDHFSAALSGKSDGHHIFYLSCSRSEFSALTATALEDLIFPSGEEGDHRSSVRGSFHGQVLETDLKEASLDPDLSPVDAWATALKSAAPAEGFEQWSNLVDFAIAGTQRVTGESPELIIGLEGRGRSRSAAELGSTWDLLWCIPPLAGLEPGLSAALEHLGRTQSAKDPDLYSPSAERRKQERGMDPHLRDLLQRFRREPEHHRLTAAPIAIAPVGRVEVRLPTPIALPLDLSLALEIVTKGVEEIAQRLVWADQEVTSMQEHRDAGHHVPNPDEAWFQVENGKVSVSPYALGILAALRRTANDLLPRWLAEDYAVGVEAIRPDQIATQGRLGLRMCRVGSEETAFSLEQAAAGHQLWVQLAILTALDHIERVVTWLAFGVDVAVNSQPPDAELLDWCRELLDRSLEGDIPTDEEPGPVERQLRIVGQEPLRRGGRTPGLLALDAELGERFYVIDEPERHLHPGVQRLTARWLSGLLRRENAQALIATHAPAFMTAPEAAYTYLLRVSGGPAELIPSRPHEFTRQSQEAIELGLDRGELLTMIRVFLWVEGRHDVAVLETLFPDRLAESGIAVIPIHGYSRSSGILDAETLMRFTEAKPAVWLDRVPEKVVVALREDQGAAQRIQGDREGYSDESRQAAKLTLAARAQDRVIDFMPHPGDDIIDLLDEGTIKELVPDYPGRAEADRAFKGAGLSGGAARKKFLEKEYGFRVSPVTLGDIARRMREKGTVPKALEEVIDRCERLALSTP